MFCTFCKAARVANEAPCPNCGAPSPLLGNAQRASWGTGAPSASATPWGDPNASSSTPFGGQWEQQQVPQASFTQPSPFGGTAPWAYDEQQKPFNGSQSQQQADYQANQNSMPSWQQQPSGQQNPLPSWQQQPSGQLNAQNDTQGQGQGSMLPVPYQGGMELQPEGRQSTISLQLIPQHAVEHLLPAQPLNPDIVHVPPMFTKPRPIVPKRRAISGLISVIIVTLLLCSGAGYIAKASGTWDNIVTAYTGKQVSNIIPNAQKIPDPPLRTDKDNGPALSVISTASLTARIDQKNFSPIEPAVLFHPYQTFYLTFTVQPNKGEEGHATVKWYTNGKLFDQKDVYARPNTNDPIKYDQGKGLNCYINQQFSQNLSGAVELYWNGTFAQRFYFAVR